MDTVNRMGKYAFFSILLGGLYLTSLHSFLLFHTLVELAGVGVALGIFFIAWNAADRIDNHYFLFIGIFQLFIAIIFLLHTLSYKGIGVFPDYDANLPTQLWIFAGYLQCLAFIGAPFFIRRKLNITVLFWLLLLFTGLFVTLIFQGFFPDCFIEGKGLTPFKRISEICICLGFLASLLPLWQNRGFFDRSTQTGLSIALVANSCARMAFIFYVSVYGLSNMLGHYFYLIYIYFIYKVIVETSITRPQQLIFRELFSQKEELQKLGDKLEDKVLKRTAQLSQTNKELTRSNKELEDLAYIVSHDLREPLRGINNFSTLLLEDYGDKIDQDGQFMLQTLRSLSKRQEAQIVSVLNYSRVGRVELEESLIDSNEIVMETLAALTISIAENKVDVRIPHPLPEALSDRTHLQVIFNNLISNAIKYNDKPEKWIEIGSKSGGDGETAVFYVRDNGIGIPKKHQERIFLMFKRLHHKDKFDGGSGAGLAIVKKIIQRHNGRIWLESEVGEGTTFYFTI